MFSQYSIMLSEPRINIIIITLHQCMHSARAGWCMVSRLWYLIHTATWRVDPELHVLVWAITLLYIQSYLDYLY